jgi:hypothetical protein
MYIDVSGQSTVNFTMVDEKGERKLVQLSISNGLQIAVWKKHDFQEDLVTMQNIPLCG